MDSTALADDANMSAGDIPLSTVLPIISVTSTTEHTFALKVWLVVIMCLVVKVWSVVKVCLVVRPSPELMSYI